MELQLRLGEWVITDGGDVANPVSVGECVASAGTVERRDSEDGLSELSLTGDLRQVDVWRQQVVVIDSGELVLCSLAAFSEAGIERGRTCSGFQKMINTSCSGADVVLISDQNGDCIGICAIPPFGDGAYRVRRVDRDGRDLLVLTLDQSC